MGEGFAAFLDAQAEIAPHPWLGQLARLEWARQQSALAAALPQADPNALIAVLAAAGDDPCLRLQPHVRVVSAAAPVLDLWRHALQPGAAADPVGGPQHVLLWREGAEVVMRGIGAGQAAFAHALMQGRTLTAAFESAQACGAPDPENLLRPLLEHALIAAVSTSPTTRNPQA